MGFSDRQVNALRRNLSDAHVRLRKVQGGRELPYIEGWHAVAEANRIFGFDGWDRETVETRCVLSREARGHVHAVYVAKVRLTVRAEGAVVVRESHGTGEAQGEPLGEVHERALKMAETDATKRALATFGRPFGLALYLSGRNGRDRQVAGGRAYGSAGSAATYPPIMEDDRRRTRQRLAPNGRYHVPPRQPTVIDAALREGRQETDTDTAPAAGDQPRESSAEHRRGHDRHEHGRHRHDAISRDAASAYRSAQSTVSTDEGESAGAESATAAMGAGTAGGTDADVVGQPAATSTAGRPKVVTTGSGKPRAEPTAVASDSTGSVSTIASTASGAPVEGLADPHVAGTPDTGAPPLQPESTQLEAVDRVQEAQLLIDWPKRYRNPAHLRFVASQPCLLCGRTPSDAHHLRYAQRRAFGRKVSDEFTVPLCRTHHRQLHQSGNELAWWTAMDRDIDPLEIAKGLWEQSRNKTDHTGQAIGDAVPHERSAR